MYKKIKKILMISSTIGVFLLGIVDNNSTIKATNINYAKYNNISILNNSIYYNQQDARWGYTKFGKYTFAASGCVPTSLAMILSQSLNRTVTPIEIGNYLYKYTNKFDKKGIGTASIGIVNVVNGYGLRIRGLNSSAEIASALQRGHAVIAAVRGGTVFAKVGSSHAIVLSGYKNGATYVKDPYTSKNNKWFNINYLYSIKSLYAEDNETGYTFHEIY